MNLLEFSQTQMRKIALILSFLTFTASPVLGHGTGHHSPKPPSPASPSPLREPKKNSLEEDVEVENISLDVTNQVTPIQTPKGLGESIFVLLIGSPLALFFLKQRSQ